MSPKAPCASPSKVCYGRLAMNRRIANALAVTHASNRHCPLRMALVIAALALCASLLGCNQTAAENPPSDYGATVEALLPTADPTVPPTPTLAPTPVPPADTPAPTYTPRPQPTYTPWPTPTRATTEERQPAKPFSAKLLDGSEFSLRDGFDSPTLLAFWAPW